jgi:hypothetical protein
MPALLSGARRIIWSTTPSARLAPLASVNHCVTGSAAPASALFPFPLPAAPDRALPADRDVQALEPVLTAAVVDAVVNEAGAGTGAR